jgi:Eukaryotic porin
LDGAAPGLKLDFKGNDSDKGDLSFTYKHSLATVTGEVDALAFSKANASISTGHGPFSAGAAVDLSIAKSSISGTNLSAGAGYTISGSLFTGIRAKNNFSDYSGIATFVAAPNVTLAGKVDLTSKGTSGVLAAVYKCNPSTTIKVKANNGGLINASVKQQVDKKFVVVGTAEVPSTFKGIKFGVNATLG